MKEMQLTLELDVRTAEQEERIQKFLARQKQSVEQDLVRITKQFNTLIDAGIGVEDILNDAEVVQVTREIDLGTYSNPDKVELTFDVVKGGVKLFRDEITIKDGDLKL